MKKIVLLLWSSLFSLAALAGAADQVSVIEPVVRLVPPGASNSAAFMVLRNGGERETKLVAAQSPAARTVELHTHLNDNGVMRMRQVPSIDLNGKGEAVLRPGGLHLMLIDLKGPLSEGGSVSLTLSFADGSSKQVQAKVVRPGESMPAMHGEHRH